MKDYCNFMAKTYILKTNTNKEGEASLLKTKLITATKISIVIVDRLLPCKIGTYTAIQKGYIQLLYKNGIFYC